jgi:hypothetical protein
MATELRAAFPSMERARRAIDSLERAGVDGGHIHLAGRPAAEAAVDTDTRGPDARVTRLVTKRTARMAVAGSLVGGVGGVLLGFGLSGDAGLWAGAIGGVVAGGAVGGVIGAYSSVDMSPAWELTQHPVDGGLVYVTVQADSPDEVQRAEEALKGEEPVRLERTA